MYIPFFGPPKNLYIGILNWKWRVQKIYAFSERCTPRDTWSFKSHASNMEAEFQDEIKLSSFVIII